MLKPTNVLIILILILSGYWFYSNLTTPQSDSAVRVTNLPWQITVVDPYTLHVFDLDIGKANLAQAVYEALLRPTDIVARYGGEKFAAILPNTGRDGA